LAQWVSNQSIKIRNRDLNKMKGSDLQGAALAVYGSRTTIIVYNSKEQKVQEFTLLMAEDSEEEYWVLSNSNIVVKKEARMFAPSNSRAISDNVGYRKALEYWVRTGYQLRYTGAFSVDAFHILTRGEGVYTSLGSATQKCKLRILYECAPVSFLVEKAGGKSSNGKSSILDVEISGYYQKGNIVVGSAEEVDRVVRFIQKYKEATKEEKKEVILNLQKRANNLTA